MYFPYLRGKQYELLALKELSELLGTRDNTIPIVEPTRAPDGGLARCFSALGAAGARVALVVNPTVGDLRTQQLPQSIADAFRGGLLPERGILALLISQNTNVAGLLNAYSEQYGSSRPLMLVHKAIAPDLEALRVGTDALQRTYDVIDDGVKRRYYGLFLADSQGVTLHDGFLRAERNADYLQRGETDFSDDHLFFTDEGWSGFADYLTIGADFAEGGFTPRAVAIHWTYEPSIGSPIKIRHFTSEKNGDIANVGGKFLEAAEKLVAFLDREDIHTQASEVMRQHLANATYPGLGIIKKLSIQNHLELVSTILAR